MRKQERDREGEGKRAGERWEERGLDKEIEGEKVREKVIGRGRNVYILIFDGAFIKSVHSSFLNS